MRRVFAVAISLVMLVVALAASTGLATADTYTRPPGNQKFVDAVIARGLSQRGVPFAYGGGDANGPSKGTPATPEAATTEAGAAAAATPGVQVPGLQVPGLQVPGLAPTASTITPQVAPAPQADVVGFDASGLMVYAFAGVGVKLPRSSGQQYNAGMKVLPAQALPGDLIFYGPDGTQSVALFLGNGQMLETTDKGVAVSPVRTNGMTPYLTRIIA